MLDSNNTSPEWQAHKGDILVLPVGSMEQHGAHLPLGTDAFEAEYVGRIVAAHFDAALLPTLPIANSLEHSGFRGTFSLRPETLMQVIRDLADEAEGQGFRILIVVNGHGGNFALTPVCRDINRRDRKLKILLVAALEFTPPGVVEPLRRRGPEIHAGAVETSAMLGMAPDKVRMQNARPPAPPAAPWGVPFRQADLTTFGVGHVAPNGPIGDPTAADATIGRQMVESAVAPMLRFLEDRIARLRAHPRYAGPEAFLP